MARLGKVELRIETEGYAHSVETTTNPVEKGVPMTDHIIKKPYDYSLSGYILGDDYERQKDYLVAEMEKGTVMTYVGRMVCKNVLIQDVQGSLDAATANGSAISIKLQTVRFATVPWTKVKVTGEKKPQHMWPGRMPTRSTVTKETYHVVKRGDTYSSLSKKYGTSIAQLRTWNKYKDTAIPVGAKLRVK